VRVRRLPYQGPYTLYAACDARGACTLLEFLDGLGADLEKDSDRMLALLERVAQQGPVRNDKISHKIEGDIWEFIQGRLRVFYFYDEGRVVVCTHGLVKKTQKTPKGDIAMANRIREQYLAAKRQGDLVIEEEADGKENV
jgi:phage-related protein